MWASPSEERGAALSVFRVAVHTVGNGPEQKLVLRTSLCFLLICSLVLLGPAKGAFSLHPLLWPQFAHNCVFQAESAAPL